MGHIWASFQVTGAETKMKLQAKQVVLAAKIYKWRLKNPIYFHSFLVSRGI